MKNNPFYPPEGLHLWEKWFIIKTQRIISIEGGVSND